MQESGANEELFSLIIVSTISLIVDHNFPVGFINRLGRQVIEGMCLFFHKAIRIRSH
jgi:hypothetical protein